MICCQLVSHLAFCFSAGQSGAQVLPTQWKSEIGHRPKGSLFVGRPATARVIDCSCVKPGPFLVRVNQKVSGHCKILIVSLSKNSRKRVALIPLTLLVWTSFVGRSNTKLRSIIRARTLIFLGLLFRGIRAICRVPSAFTRHIDKSFVNMPPVEYFWSVI